MKKNDYGAPWAITQDCPGHEIGARAIVDGEGFTICNPSPMGDRTAQLIRAAPELLQALEDLMKIPDYDGTPATSRERLRIKRAARRAIRAAKGKI